MRHSPRWLQLPWRSRDHIARDVDAELSFHLDARIAELVAGGLGADAARQKAREEFGDLEFTRAYCTRLDEQTTRETRTADSVAGLLQDLRYAVRVLARNPGFAALSLLTLALAIGANTAIFSVARAVLLAPLPYANAQELVAIFESWPGQPTSHTPLSPANFIDYRAQQRAFTDLGAYMEFAALTWKPADGGNPTALTTVGVDAAFLKVLGVQPLLGRAFTDVDDSEGNDHLLIASYGFWQRSLGGDTHAVGRTLTINGQQYRLIGVMPRGFSIGDDEDVWVPLGLYDALKDPVRARRQHYVHVIGRLRPHTTFDAARADLGVIARRLEAQYPEANAGRFAIVTPLRETMIGNLRPALLLLQAAAALVLLIACANLANLTLSRTMGRRREMAVRAALGAGRARLARQLMAETVLLGVVGGALGVGLALGATRVLLALNPDTLPAMFSAVIDARVLLFSLSLSVVTGVVFGLAPALDASRVTLHDSLKDGGRSSSGGRSRGRMRQALVVTQIGLAVMLLVGAGLLVRSFARLANVELGFDPAQVMTAQLRASGERYDSAAAVNRLFDSVLGEIERAPGVVAVGAVDVLPMRGNSSTSLRIVGEPVDERHLPDIRYVGIRGAYFNALRIPLRAGRLYDENDTPDSPKTVLVNEAALALFPDHKAIGRRIRIGPDPKGDGMLVVGVVGDVRATKFEEAATPALYANHRQETWERTVSIVIRTSGDPHAVTPTVLRAVRAADPSLAVRDLKTLDDVVGSNLAPRRFALALASAFAVVALALAAIGIYGVLSFGVAARTRELGVRIALGASTRSVLMLVVRQGLAWSAVGLAMGVAGAAAGARMLARMLYGVGTLDAATYLAVIIGLGATVLVACLIPARRAANVDPLVSMQAE